MYATPWFRQRGLRPIDVPQAGQGKVVDPLSTKGTPEAVQTVARSDMILHLSAARPRPLPLYACAERNVTYLVWKEFHSCLLKLLILRF